MKTTVTVKYLERISDGVYKSAEATTDGIPFNFNLAVIRAHDPEYGFDHRKHIWSVTHINSGYAVCYSNRKPGAEYVAQLLQNVDFDDVFHSNSYIVRDVVIDALKKGREQGYKYCLTYYGYMH